MPKPCKLAEDVRVTLIADHPPSFRTGDELIIDRVSPMCTLLGVKGQVKFLPFECADLPARQQIVRFHQGDT